MSRTRLHSHALSLTLRLVIFCKALQNIAHHPGKEKELLTSVCS